MRSEEVDQDGLSGLLSYKRKLRGLHNDVLSDIEAIVRKLDISKGGLRQHLHRIYSKLGVKNRPDLLIFYYKMLNGESPEEE